MIREQSRSFSVYKEFKRKRSLRTIRARKKKLMDNSTHSNDITWSSGYSSSRRQRIFNIVKQTKDSYFNAAKNSLRSYYGDDINGEESRSVISPIQKPQFLGYPSYTRKTGEAIFETHVRGLLFSTGHRSRRNNLLFSICKQFLRNDPASNVEQRLESLDTDSSTSLESVSTLSSNSDSVTSTTSDTSSMLAKEDVLKERIAGFMVRNIPNMYVTLTLYDEFTKKSTETDVFTDNAGNFDVAVKTTFKPTSIKAQCSELGIFSEIPSYYVENSGFGLISDIDDTIKHTGVVGDKRSMFLNVFVNGFETWEIKDMSLWYTTLKDSRNLDFFYVSNAPSQIYSTLYSYISDNYPLGPLFLKQYSGNLLSSIMKSSAQRKLTSILRICADFPSKKFILVGDSGEQDLEAYISAAVQFPSQIIGIYIRCCKKSLSDDPQDDQSTMKKLNNIIKENYLSLEKNKPDIPDLMSFDDSDEESSDKKIPPLKPVRKPKLSKDLEQEIFESKIATNPIRPLPPLPPRKLIDVKERKLDTTIYSLPSSQNDYGTYSEYFDKKSENWVQRVNQAVLRLKENDVHTRFMFFDDPIECLEDSLKKIDAP